MKRLFSVLLCCVVFWHSTLYAQNTAVNTESALSELTQQLPNTKLRKMASLVEKIAAIEQPQTRNILQAMLKGELYYIKTNKTIVHAVKSDKQYALTNVLTGESLSSVNKSSIKKIRTNNSLRSRLRSFIAKLDLTHTDKKIRIGAVKQLLDNPSKTGLQAVTDLITQETDDDVRELMNITLLIAKLQTGDHGEKIAAISQLENTLEPSVKNTMVKMLNDLPAENKTLEQEELATSLSKVISNIEDKRDFFEVIENIFFGLSLGSVLLLAAIGLAITFGVMGVINMAHGEMMMLGAYTTYVIQLAFPHLIEYSLLMAIPAAFLVSGIVGIIIERGVIRYLKGRPLETLLATFGISLILQQLVRTIFSPLNRQVQAPEWMSGSWQINPVFSLTFNRLYIILFSLMVFFSLLMILKKSSLGLHVRAVSQNRDMARALSIKSDWVDAITFGLGSGIAGIAGVVLSQLTNVGPNLGQAYIIDSFLVVVFGGVGNLWGTLVAAMSLGTVNKFLEPITGSVLANIIVLVGLVLFIQKRPKGLFPQKGRSVD